MKTLHRIFAVFLLIFIIVHLGNHAAAAFGIDQFNTYISTVRVYYKHPIVEPTLITLIIAQGFTGVWLTITSFQRPEKRSIISWIELLSAWVFLFFIIIHLTAIAVTRYYFEMQTDFYWAATMMRETRLQPYIIGFHFLGVAAVSIHTGIGVKYLFGAIGAASIGRILGIMLAIAGIAAGTIGIAAYTGVFYPIVLDF